MEIEEICSLLSSNKLRDDFEKVRRLEVSAKYPVLYNLQGVYFKIGANLKIESCLPFWCKGILDFVSDLGSPTEGELNLFFLAHPEYQNKVQCYAEEVKEAIGKWGT